VTTAALCLSGCSTVSTQRAEEKRVLVFTRNGLTLQGKKGFVHDNIASSVEALKKLGAENGFGVDVSEDPAVFTAANLKKYRALVFSNTNNEVFDTEEQKKAFQNYVRAGGGVVGIHSACAMTREWRWMWQLMGGTFDYHPKLQPFTIYVVDRKHASTAHLGETWEWTDESYFLKEMPKGLHILLEGDLTKLDDKRKPKDEKRRALAWCHEFEGGRCWFTALGHKKEHYSDPNLMKHILGGIQWAMGKKK
jgi:type 1 glutamine amidotransferase